MLSPLNIFKTFLQLIDVIAKKIVGLFLSAMLFFPSSCQERLMFPRLMSLS